MQQRTSLTLSPDRREAAVCGTAGFPCGAYFTDIALYPASAISWHWREEIELSMVVGGAARVRFGSGAFVLNAGEGMFINAEALHAFDIVGNEGCRMISLVLDYNMLAGREDSVFARRYVMPLVQSGAVKIVRLSPEVEWQQAVLKCLREAFLTYDEGKYGFELIVRARLTECLWHIVRNMRAAMREYEGASEASEERAKRMLDFIHMHYAEPIQLADIAAAANVGERECLRAFKKTLSVTPTAYLLRYRASMSAQLLLDTDKSIAEICFEVGFNSQSHYGQMFRRFFHMSPREYRVRYGKAARQQPL